MALPQAVQKQVDAADALMAEANKPVATPPEQTTSPEATQEPQAASPTPEPTPSPATPPQPPRDEWQQKYQILQGKYNAEVPQLHHQVKDLTRRLSDTAAQMEQIAKSQETKPPEKKQEADPKDVDDFGADLVGMVHRVSMSAVGGMAAKVDGILGGLLERISRLESGLANTAKTTGEVAEESFFANLTRAVPDWEATNQSQKFLEWLGEVDPLLGATRQAALDQAHKNLDLRRIVGIFRAFESSQPPKQAPKQASALERQIAPGTSAAPQPTSPDKKTMTPAEVSAFYKDVALGRYKGREAEAAKLEASINLALQEQRIK